MFKFVADIKSNSDTFNKIQKALKEEHKKEILVGIPSEKSSDRGSVNNAELLFIHTNGSAVRNIPARPVLQPAIMGNREKISESIKKITQNALEGDIEGVHQAQEEAGMVAQNICRDWFEDPRNNWAENKTATIEQKGSERPLIDSGEMRKSIAYVVRDK